VAAGRGVGAVRAVLVLVDDPGPIHAVVGGGVSAPPELNPKNQRIAQGAVAALLVASRLRPAVRWKSLAITPM
jgi:hypothetical protein